MPIGARHARANPVLVVTKKADTGAHTLREAITIANSTPGPDLIQFDLGGAAPHVITAATTLPPITETLMIDGTSQPGFDPTTHAPVVVLQGVPGGGFDALEIGGWAAAGTQIRGLEIVSWRGRAIYLNSTPDVVIAGNYIGTDGTAALDNGYDFHTFLGVIETGGECRNLLIGGHTPADRNVIAGNHGAAIYIDSTGGTRVQGNYVGTNAAGTAALGGGSGVFADQDGVTIGGTARGTGNVLSAGYRGVFLAFNGEISVLGNRIGTNAAGTSAIPNTFGVQVFGVQVQSGSGVTVGGTTARSRNLISGNGVGISVEQSSGNVVQGNWIGTDAGGTVPIPNDIGVEVSGVYQYALAQRNRIGGYGTGAGNVISGNHTAVLIDSGSDNLVQGNLVGTRPDGKTALPNDQGAIVIRHSGLNAATGNRIGGIIPSARNVIAFNGGPGVEVGGDESTSHTTILGNSIHGNDGLGIDLEPNLVTGITPNDDDDTDTGPNGLQNFPGISQATSGPEGTTVFGSLESTPSTFFVVDVYASDVADPIAGEGAVFLGDVGVGTDAGGNGVFSVTYQGVLGNVVSATATSPGGDTSEFSPALSMVGPGGLRFARDSYSVGEGAGHVTIKVQRVGGATGAVTIKYATSDGSAKAPGDYQATTGTLHFADGQKTLSFSIPIVNDTKHEPAESFTVHLSNPGGGAALGDPSTTTVTIRASD